MTERPNILPAFLAARLDAEALPRWHRFAFMTEKIPNAGEDAEPLLWLDETTGIGALAVFDGLGGAGSAVYRDEQGAARTGAAWAADTARDVTDERLRAALADPGGLNPVLADDLRRALMDSLRARLRGLTAEASGAVVRSKMRRALPTTLAAVAFWRDGAAFDCHALWAGDSRCYLLTPNAGLQQISRDDLQTDQDALANLQDDAPMSNVVSADQDFQINHAQLTLTPPFILLTATDGCFAYLDTPFRFEAALLTTLMDAADAADWRRLARAALVKYAQDDTSLALVAVGWSAFAEVQTAFQGRLDALLRDYIAPLDDLNRQVEAAHRALDEAKQTLERLRDEQQAARRRLWGAYKPLYEAKLTPPPPSDDPP